MEALAKEVLNISKVKLKAVKNDPVKTASLVNLVYVLDNQPGIERLKHGKNFTYRSGNKKLTDAKVLERIKGLVIPPAWENVWICSLDNGHLQATGVDAMNRKQYRYHTHWNILRNQTKFHKLLEFGNSLPVIRKQLEKDISLPGLPVDKVLALAVMLMERTNIRVGNNFYEKLYGSFGLTTLKDKHVSFKGDEVKFIFKGKKGVEHDINLKSKKLAKLVKQCRDIPGKELFQYYDDNGVRHPIDSGMVNTYIKKISGTDFSAKDFRTWYGSLHALQAFKELGGFATETEKKSKIVSAIDMVAKHLGNTRTVCKKYYVHPALITIYEDNKLKNYIEKNKRKSLAQNTSDELLLLKILEKN